jgi:hypothetical protein
VTVAVLSEIPVLHLDAHDNQQVCAEFYCDGSWFWRVEGINAKLNFISYLLA